MTFIFITDLDGTLLGTHDLDFGPIKCDVTSLLDDGHLLVFASSKTQVELEQFCDDLGRKIPYIYENGAGSGYFDLFGECGVGSILQQNPKAISADALFATWEQHIPTALKTCCFFVKDMDKGAQRACLGLKEEALVVVVVWNGRPISVLPENFVELEVTECAPNAKGDTVTGGTKLAMVETGIEIKVPLFVEQGDVIRIDTRTEEYVSRAGK